MKKPTIHSVLTLGAAGVAIWLALDSRSQAQSSLLPFQGRLTDATGVAVPDGAKVVEFKIYDAPTGGTVKWAGEVHKLSVNGGLVNTMLGSKASLGGVDFSAPCYLQITVDANGDHQITAADPPLLPRQSVVPAVYAVEAGNARDSVKLAGADWSAVMVNSGGEAVNDPSAGYLNGGKLRAGSIDGAKLAAGSVGGGAAGLIIDGSVTKADLGTGSVASDEIEDGSIQAVDLSVGLQNSVTPPGAVMAYAAPAALAAPPGWELCDGRAVGRTDPKYAGLYAVIGTSHGAGNFTATFNLPDYRGRFLRGVDDADGAAGFDAAGRDPDAASRTALGTGAPTSVGSIQTDNIPEHTHDNGNLFAAITHLGGSFHFREVATPSWGRSGVSANAGSDSAGNMSEGVKVLGTTAGPSGLSGETRPKNAYVNFLIKL